MHRLAAPALLPCHPHQGGSVPSQPHMDLLMSLSCNRGCTTAGRPQGQQGQDATAREGPTEVTVTHQHPEPDPGCFPGPKPGKSLVSSPTPSSAPGCHQKPLPEALPSLQKTQSSSAIFLKSLTGSTSPAWQMPAGTRQGAGIQQIPQSWCHTANELLTAALPSKPQMPAH